MAFKGTPNLKGRAKGSQNKATKEIKTLLADISDTLINSIDLKSLNDADKIRLLTGILPYITAKQNYHEVVNERASTSWVNDYSEDDLQKLLNNA